MINTELIADGTSLATLLQQKEISDSEPFFSQKLSSAYNTI